MITKFYRKETGNADFFMVASMDDYEFIGLYDNETKRKLSSSYRVFIDS